MEKNRTECQVFYKYIFAMRGAELHNNQESKVAFPAFLMLWVYLALQVMDFVTTVIGASYGIQERNELLLWIATIVGGLPALLVAKAVSVAPAIMALHSPKTWPLLLVFVVLDVFYLDIVSGNIIAIYEALKT